VLIAWAWSQLAHEGGTFAAAIIAIACLAYLTRRGANVLRNRERKLLDQGSASGLTPGFREDRRRFSLLDLLVVITLVGALAGLIKGFAGEDKHGLPYRIHDEWNVIHDAQQREK
jgi:hypothetical protein